MPPVRDERSDGILGGCGLVLMALAALAGCTAQPSARSATPATHASTAPVPESAASISACPATADLGQSGGPPERQGVGTGASLWALLFPTEPRIVAGQEIKIVWRMTGSGNLSIEATGPHRAVVTPVWGPDLHSGSTWQRPGDEWGTGWVFPTPGCWTIQAKRSTGSGRLTLRVA